MGVLDFNGYQLQYLQEGRGYYDDDGVYHSSEDIWVSIGRCNAQQSGGYQIIPLPDGDKDYYSFTIIVRNPRCREFKHGERIILKSLHGCEDIRLTVKGFSRHNNFCKIYA